jgi:SAM-dependent methyltransferase
MQEGGAEMSLPKPKSEREWTTGGLSSEAVFLVDALDQENRLGAIVDVGAGEGRHSLYAVGKGAEKVIAIEKDPEQTAIIRNKKEKEGLETLEVIEGDVLEVLANLDNDTVDGLIDCGMSHCLTEPDQRAAFVSLILSKLKPGGLYSITHFSENEVLSTEHFQTDLEGLKNLFSEEDWEMVMPWKEESWQRDDGKKHYAYNAVLRKK